MHSGGMLKTARAALAATMVIGAATIGATAVVAAAVGAAGAQAATGTQKPKGEQKAEKSVILGVTFPDKPFPLADDGGTYASFMASAAKDVGRQCKTMESYGWDLKVGDQDRLNQIVDATMNAVQKDGYKAVEVKPQTAEGTNAVAITVDKAKKQAFLLWAPVGKGVVLLICESTPAK